jgi:hypothetical protein
MKQNRLAILTIAAIFACAPFALAQTTEPEKVIVLQGEVKSIEWVHPNVQIHMDVRTGVTQVDHWTIAGDDPGLMVQRGLTRDSLKSGDAIILCGLRPGGSRVLEGGGIALVDGRTLYFGRAAEECRQTGGKPQTASSKPAITPIVNSPVQPFVNSPVQPFVSAPVTAFGVPPFLANTSVATATDTKKPMILQGVIRAVNQSGPKVTLHVDVQADGGRIDRWSVEGDAPRTMLQALRSGEPVIVCGTLLSPLAPRNTTRVLIAGGLSFADGSTIYYGEAADSCRGTVITPQTVSAPASPKPVVNSPVQPFVNPPVTQFGAPR